MSGKSTVPVSSLVLVRKMVRVIAEVGINHRGSPEVAENLVSIAGESGAWGVKFQYRSKNGFYNSVDEIGDEIISQELERSYLAPEDLLAISRRAQARGIKAGISFFRFSDAEDFGDDLDVFDFFKVPSAELMNIDLIESLAGLGKTLIVSTGGHSQEDISEVIRRTRHLPGVVFLHCVSNYPVLLGNQQLLFIRTLAEMSGTPVGYSSHDQDWEVCLLAMANGAEYIERHITMDKNGPGLDDSSSSDPEEFRRMCKLLNAYAGIQGQGERHINQGELINMQNLGSSLYALRDLAPGETVDLSNCVVRSPRKGVTLSDLEKRDSRSVQRPVKAGQALTGLHFAPPMLPLDRHLVDFCDNRELSIPIRLHDAEILQERFPIENFELHLSYSEVDRFKSDPGEFLARIKKDKTYSIHLPDYMRGNRLVDPLSKDTAIRADSEDMIDVCVALAAELEQSTGSAVPIVGSFSRLCAEGKRETYKRLNDFLGEIEQRRRISIHPQWLPRIAWYFGGAEVLDMFCGSDDIALVRELDMKICLDISHLILSANYERANWRDWYAELLPMTRHVHIADAEGIDGEGIEFGKGDLGDAGEFLDLPYRKVLEVWQGHLSEGDGFERAIRQLGQVDA